MKRLTYSIWAFALASLFVASCSKEAELELTPVEEPEVEMVTLNFTAEKAGEETKTQAVIDGVNNKVNYEWTDEDEDNITVYLVDGAKLTKVASTATMVNATQLKISATVPKADSYTIRAILAREFYSAGKPVVSKYQSPKTDNFDPKGDILISDDKNISTDGTSTGDMLLTFNRKVAINQMTLKNLGAGEKISKVEISSTKDLVGYNDGSSFTAVSDSKKLVLTYLNETVPASGEFPVYFSCMENDGHTLTVTVTTNTKVYTKTFGAAGIDFALGQFLTFRVTMPAGVAPSTTWNLVKNAAALSDGDIIYIANIGGTYAMGGQSGSYRTQVAATPINDGEQITPDNDFQEITLEKTGDNYYLNVGSNCLYANSSSNNNIGTGTQAAAGNNGKWSISVAADGKATIVAQGTNTRNHLRYNSGNTRFSCYASTSDLALPVLYRKTVPDATVWNLYSLEVTKDPSKDSYAGGESFDPTGMEITATYKDNAGVKSDKVVVLSNSDLTISPSVLTAGDTKVTLSYQNKTVDVEGLTVTSLPYTMILNASSLETGVDYYIGCSSADTYSGGTTGLWKGTISGTTSQAATVDKTFTVGTGSFNNVTDAELVVLEEVSGQTDQFYIKVKSSGKYLYNASSTNLSIDDTNKTAWTIADISGSGKNGMYLQSTTCKISSNGSSNRMRAYASGTYKGIVFFKKN